MGSTKIFVAGLVGLLVAASSLSGSFAQDNVDPATAIQERKALMRTIGQTMRAAGNASGDAAVEQAQILVDGFTRFHNLFPEGSETGGETEAAPTIWSDRAGFEEVSNKAIAQAETVLAAAQAGDATAYTAALRGFGPTCGECHQTYRAD